MMLTTILDAATLTPALVNKYEGVLAKLNGRLPVVQVSIWHVRITDREIDKEEK